MDAPLYVCTNVLCEQLASIWLAIEKPKTRVSHMTNGNNESRDWRLKDSRHQQIAHVEWLLDLTAGEPRD